MNAEGDRSLEELTTHVRVTHHVTTRALLRSMHEALGRLADIATGPDLERIEALQRAFAYFRDDLLTHLVTEERVVFPYVIALEHALHGLSPPPHAGFPSIASPVQVARNEQQTTRTALARLETAILTARRDWPSHRWETLEADVAALHADLEIHVALEQEELFPRAIAAEQTLVERRLRDVDGGLP